MGRVKGRIGLQPGMLDSDRVQDALPTTVIGSKLHADEDEGDLRHLVVRLPKRGL